MKNSFALRPLMMVAVLAALALLLCTPFPSHAALPHQIPSGGTALVQRDRLAAAANGGNVDTGGVATPTSAGALQGWTLGGLGDGLDAADVDTFTVASTSAWDWFPGDYNPASTTTIAIASCEISSLGGTIGATCDTLFYAYDWSIDGGTHWIPGVASFQNLLLKEGTAQFPIKIDPQAVNSGWLAPSFRLRLRADGNLISYPRGKAVIRPFQYNR